MIGRHHAVCGGLALVLHAGAAMLGFGALITNEWLVINRDRPPRTEVSFGLLQECSGGNCAAISFGDLSVCRASESSIQLRYNLVVAFLALGLIASVSAVVASSMLHSVLLRLQRAVPSPREAVRVLGVASTGEWRSQLESSRRTAIRSFIFGLVASIAALACFACGLAMYRHTTNTFVHCERTFCDVVVAIDPEASCWLGGAYRACVGALVFASLAAVTAVARLLMFRPAAKSILHLLAQYRTVGSATPPGDEGLHDDTSRSNHGATHIDGGRAGGDRSKRECGEGEQGSGGGGGASRDGRGGEGHQKAGGRVPGSHARHGQETDEDVSRAQQQQKYKQLPTSPVVPLGGGSSSSSNGAASRPHAPSNAREPASSHVPLARATNNDTSARPQLTPQPPPQPQRPLTPVDRSHDDGNLHHHHPAADGGVGAGATPPPPPPLSPPAEGVWELDGDSGLFWCDAEQLYFDPYSGHFYDPHEDMWWNPETDEWYPLR